MADYKITTPDYGDIEKVRRWLEDNAIDPSVVPLHSTITVDHGRITTDRYVLNDHGKKVLIGGDPVIMTFVVDLVLPWPDDLGDLQQHPPSV